MRKVHEAVRLPMLPVPDGLEARIRQATIDHSYPFCWRSDTPLIYKAISTWFVRLDPLKPKLLKNNQLTHWVPEHLRDLHTVFWSWELAQAAYNAGEMTVQRAIRDTGTRDFWTLSHSPWLRDETKDYVPQIHAATLIGQAPERYGFAVTPEQPVPLRADRGPQGHPPSAHRGPGRNPLSSS